MQTITNYKTKLTNDKTEEEKLLKAEQQIKEGKTVKATEVFEELKELYEF